MLNRIQTVRRILPVFLATIVAVGAFASAQPSKRVFPDRVEVEKSKLEFNGLGLCEYGIFAIDIYWGALYLEKPTPFALDVIRSRQKKRIHLHFVRSLTKAQLQKAFTASVEYNTGKTVSRYRAALNRLCSMMADIKNKQDLIFDYVPGKGLKVTLNKKARGWVKDEDFCRLFFRLYFGKYPPDKNLKRGMLKNRTRR